MRLELQFFGGRGGAGGRRVESRASQEATQTATREKTLDEMNYGEAGAYFAANREKLGLSKNEDAYTAAYNVKQGIWKIENGKVVKNTQSPIKKPAAPKATSSKPSTPKESKPTGSKRLENMVNKLRDNPSGTIIGVKGDTTYVVEATQVRSTYVKPNGVRSNGTVTRYSVTPIRRGTNSADTKIFKNSSEAMEYLKNTGAKKWTSRKRKLSTKQMNKLFD